MAWTKESLKKLREQYCHTQEEWAERIRVNPETIRRWEQGRGKPPGPATVILDLLAVIAGMSPEGPA
ncbi:MAG: helix-turn-helix domain-containing protein [Thermomicrobiales bacterium]